MNSLVLAGKTAIVTGAGQGIGRAIAIAEAGARVSIVDLNLITAKAVAVELGDLQRQNLRDIQRSFRDTDETHILQHLTSGLFGICYFLQESYEYLKARRGSVVNLASAAGVLGLPNHFS